ncbi:MAG TPA: Gfo/Idh/MocA family oxidoreductase [Acidobacteriota bacterium]|nr:Gfo/Idh/MocA family oxidoreductase [Acidobacteriota bacterium]
MAHEMTRRKFLGEAAISGAGLSVVPRHVLGGRGYVAPNDKLTLALIGCGTQGLREILPILAMPEVEVVAVCDPNKKSTDYVDWSKHGLRRQLARALEAPDWEKGPGIPGGREIAREVVETYYAKKRPSGRFQGCTSYADFRELLAQEKELDAVKVMTPDHLHAYIAIAAMEQGKSVMMHKPLANRVIEARQVVETARKTEVPTHFSPANDGKLIGVIKEWIDDGAIGTLREIHNWSSRPFWPHYAKLPTETPPLPEGFDWDLWLGPSLERPYHPNYTHAVFRGWYEFGGGPIADMGHYSLWSVFRMFDLDSPVSVESTPSHYCEVVDGVSGEIKNDYSFPVACTIRFKFAAKGNRPGLDLFWYDGGIKPATPEELEADEELEREGMLLVGDSGKILAGFRGEKPRIIPESKMRAYFAAKGIPEPQPEGDRTREDGDPREVPWLEAFQGGKPSFGDFRLAGPISDMVNLGAVSLRLGGKRLLWDAKSMKITNVPEANKYLVRECRKGWELNVPLG